MLVLTRKASEQIQIGDQVVITILQVKGQSVRIGIEAPRDVLVLRGELPRHQHAPIPAGDAPPERTDRAGVAPDRAGLSSTRQTSPHHSVATTTRRTPGRTLGRTPGRARPGSDARRHPDRASALAARPAFLNHL